MRTILFLIVALCIALIVDAFAFDGRYRDAVWQGAQYQGQKLRTQIDFVLRKF